MAKYAHIKAGVIFEIIELTDEEALALPSNKALYILPYIIVPRPVFDSATHFAPVRQPDDIQTLQVVQVWAAALAKTPVQIGAEKQARAENEAKRLVTKVLKLTMTGQFNQENRLRVLEGSPTISVNQYLNGLDALPTISDADFIAKIKTLA